MDPAALALAATVAFVALGYVLFGRKGGPAPGGPGAGGCPLGAASAPDGTCWAIQTAPDLSSLTPAALSALVKARLTLKPGSKISVFATAKTYPKTVAILTGIIDAAPGKDGVADSYTIHLTDRAGRGEDVPDASKPTVPQVVANVSPLGVVDVSGLDLGTTPPLTPAGLPLPIPTPVFGGFPGGNPGAPIPLDATLAAAPVPLTPSLPTAAGAETAILHAAVAGTDTGREIPALVISRAHGDLDPRPFTGIVTAAAAQAALGMDFVHGGLYVTFLPTHVFAVRPATAADLPTAPALSPAVHPATPAFGGEFGHRAADRPGY